MTSPYSVNWITSTTGNGILSGDTLKVTVVGAEHFTIALYKDGAPINTDFAWGDGPAEIILKVRDRDADGEWFTRGYAPGAYTLKTRAWINKRTQGWDDEFVVVA